MTFFLSTPIPQTGPNRIAIMANEEPPTIEHLCLPPSPNSSQQLHEKAGQIISTYQATPSIASLPDTLHALLTTVIKPLFSANPHPSLAPSGRKALYSNDPILPHSELLILDDSDKPWKLAFTTLTSPLLHCILASYPLLLPPPSTLRTTLDQHIFLLTPALLNIIDDPSPTTKSTGLHLLHSLCTNLHLSASPILHTSNLLSVFTSTLTPNFLLLPTLTPETDSITILSPLYTAYLSLITASFPTLPSNTPPKPTPTTPSPKLETQRQSHLTHLLRHGILASLTHLNAGTNTSHPKIVTLLLTKLVPTLEMMGVYATPHLQHLLPLLRGVLTEPFALAAAPEMVCAALEGMEVLVRGCRERIGARWWGEVLRGCVGCWCEVLDEEEEEGEEGGKGAKEGLGEVKRRLRVVVGLLGEVVEEREWEEARRRMVEEEGGLRGLFEKEPEEGD